MFARLRRFVVGKERDPSDHAVFHKLSLVAFLAWVGLGSDGISSSCYGPEEAFLALGTHPYLALILAVIAAATVFIISASYAQIIDLFPSGGGGYLVASKLLHPNVGMVCGCALIIDYVLTITISIASGVDALFSFLPAAWSEWKVITAMVLLSVLIILNLRGVKESVMPLVPIFLVFIITHAFAILYVVVGHLGEVPNLIAHTTQEVRAASDEIGVMGLVIVLLRAYSLGGGTYTGIEAVSNGLPILREPRAETGKKTMLYMAVSLAFMASGLMVAYLLAGVHHEEGKTLNTVLFETISQHWPGGRAFVITSLLSAALILVIAAQTGFLDGPRVLANMAIDGWMPNRFSLLSERLVTQNGILIFGAAAAALMWFTGGSVRYLVVLYSINVFLTFSLSQLGMIVHWWKQRSHQRLWRRRIIINGTGFALTSLILVAVVVLKFQDGGWLTLIMTGSLVASAMYIKHEYNLTRKHLRRLDRLTSAMGSRVPMMANAQIPTVPVASTAQPHHPGGTAAIMVSGYNGMGIHTLLNVLQKFPGQFTHFIFVQVGLVDAGKFKGTSEIEHLRQSIDEQLQRYVADVLSVGLAASTRSSVGTDIIEEIDQHAVDIAQKFPGVVFFSGQLVFRSDTWITRLLHNYTGFAIQRRLYSRGLPMVVLPVKI